MEEEETGEPGGASTVLTIDEKRGEKWGREKEKEDEEEKKKERLCRI